jgi:hypothetical protein
LLQPLDDIVFFVTATLLLPATRGGDAGLLCKGLGLLGWWCGLGLVTISFTLSFTVTVTIPIPFAVSLTFDAEISLASADAGGSDPGCVGSS